MNSIVSEKRFIQERIGIPYENLSQSYLRAETQLTNLSQYSFLLQKGQVQTPIVTEQLLELNDQFVITHFTLGLKYIASDTPSALQHLNAEVYTFADPAVFTGNAANAAGIFNSNLSFTINRRDFLPAFPTSAFKRVPTTQTNSPSEGGAAVMVNGYDNGLYGYYPSEPTLIDGRQTLDIQVDLGNASAIDDSGYSAYVVFQVRGYLVVNAKS